MSAPASTGPHHRRQRRCVPENLSHLRKRHRPNPTPVRAVMLGTDRAGATRKISAIDRMTHGRRSRRWPKRREMTNDPFTHGALASTAGEAGGSPQSNVRDRLVSPSRQGGKSCVVRSSHFPQQYGAVDRCGNSGTGHSVLRAAACIILRGFDAHQCADSRPVALAYSPLGCRGGCRLVATPTYGEL